MWTSPEPDRRLPQRQLADGAIRPRVLRLRDRDRSNRDAELFGRGRGVLGQAVLLLAVMEEITAHREVLDKTLEGPQPLQRVAHLGRPVGVGDQTNLETRPGRRLHRLQQYRVKQERLAALEIDPLHRPQLIGLVEDLVELIEAEGPFLERAAPHKAVVALRGAGVGEEDVDS